MDYFGSEQPENSNKFFRHYSVLDLCKYSHHRTITRIYACLHSADWKYHVMTEELYDVEVKDKMKGWWGGEGFQQNLMGIISHHWI